MTSLLLPDLKNYNAKLIAEYLEQQSDNAFQIIIPRDDSPPAGVPEQSEGKEQSSEGAFSIFWQFHMAAYAGQKLYYVSESFAYYVPCPQSKNNFQFEIQVAEIKRLSAALAFIICGYYDNDKTMLRFNEEAAKFLTDSFEGKTECNTWGLLHIANHYLGKHS